MFLVQRSADSPHCRKALDKEVCIVPVATGTRLGSYEITGLLGAGGMGEVWRARHLLLGRTAAVKVIRPEALGSASEAQTRALLRRFEREARATSALRSPHTVQVYDFGTAPDGSFYYVMELLAGRDLNSLVGKHGPMLAERVIFILLQACESLAEAHRSGLVHRDIKPGNIVLSEVGFRHDFVKVLDFGLVTQAPSLEWPDSGLGETRLTAEGVVAGSPGFMWRLN
jgi:serine/threonine-protein kinase